MNKNKTKALLMYREKEHPSSGISISDKTKILEKYFEKENKKQIAKTIEENWKHKVYRIQTIIKS